MSSKKKKNLTPTQQQYQQIAKSKEPKRPILLNSIKAFLVGGLICVIGQAIKMGFIHYFEFTEETAGNPTIAVLIFISTLLTSFGVYDYIAQWAGAGTAVPVTGFANTVTSAALEHRTEGFVLGVGGNMFKIAGPVIVFGVFSAFVVAIIKLTIEALGGI
ncbi:UNVERIFIED_CONTAM: stage V sporulation protein AC [Acetivibrio alkalicellulosi]